jgi:hypothetical protein
MTPIQYIGKRPEYLEGTYGSSIRFLAGQTVSVPDDLALKLLRHPDVYAKGDLKQAVDVPIERPEVEQLAKETALQDMRDLIKAMPKDIVLETAERDYGRKLDKRKNEENLRAELVQLIDQYGLVA